MFKIVNKNYLLKKSIVFQFLMKQEIERRIKDDFPEFNQHF